MAKVKQFGGRTYNTDNFPYVIMKDEKVEGRASTLQRANKIKVMVANYNPESVVMVFNEKTKKFIPWKKKELSKLKGEDY